MSAHRGTICPGLWVGGALPSRPPQAAARIRVKAGRSAQSVRVEPPPRISGGAARVLVRRHDAVTAGDGPSVPPTRPILAASAAAAPCVRCHVARASWPRGAEVTPVQPHGIRWRLDPPPTTTTPAAPLGPSPRPSDMMAPVSGPQKGSHSGGPGILPRARGGGQARLRIAGAGRGSATLVRWYYGRCHCAWTGWTLSSTLMAGRGWREGGWLRAGD